MAVAVVTLFAFPVLLSQVHYLQVLFFLWMLLLPLLPLASDILHGLALANVLRRRPCHCAGAAPQVVKYLLL